MANKKKVRASVPKGVGYQDKKNQSERSRKGGISRRADHLFGAVTGDIDYTFFFLIILVLSFGMVMLLSASTPAASRIYNNSYYFFIKQMVFVVIGLIGMYVLSRIDYRSYKKFVPMFMVICTVLLILVAIPGIGQEHNGSRRWLPIPGTQLQPSELMKLAIAMYFALSVERGKYDITKLSQNLPYAGIIGFIFFLMMLEPHLSGALVIAGVAVSILIVGGTPVKPIIGAGLIGAPLGAFCLYKFDAVRWARITSFLDPFADPQKTGYQITQALYAIGSGGIFGRGLGQSIQKRTYLPEPYNDFIFAVICEELGLVGAIAVIGLFALLVLRGIKIAMNAQDTYGTLLVVGIMAQIAIQAVLNISVATSSIPNTGVALPFFSYGGTSIMVLLLEMGIVLNVSRNQIKK